MTLLARLGLGTVQFGMAYGVSNLHGRPAESDVVATLQQAVSRGIEYIDTSPAYGDAEVMLGRHLPKNHPFRVVTKLPRILADTIEPCHARALLDGVERSIDRLQTSSLYGLLVHHSPDLRKPGWERVVEVLTQAQARGWVKRIGASIYDADQLTMVERAFRPDLVQLPLNVLDRRLLASGTIARLKTEGIEIHTRSAFLQGLLLMDPADLPEFFQPARQRISDLHHAWNKRGLKPLAACLAFVLQQPEVDAVIVGVNQPTEFSEIADAIEGIGDVAIAVDDGPSLDSHFLDPSQWPVLSHQETSMRGDASVRGR